MCCRVLFEDDRASVHLLNPVNDEVLLVEGFEGRLEAALWDAHDSCWFLLYDGHKIFSYVYTPNSITGAGPDLPDSHCLFPGRNLAFCS